MIGGLAQLARALPWHGRGHRFDSDILHKGPLNADFFIYVIFGLPFSILKSVISITSVTPNSLRQGSKSIILEKVLFQAYVRPGIMYITKNTQLVQKL
jgi:hypothetical protein